MKAILSKLKENPLIFILPFNLLNLFLVPLTDQEAYYWSWAQRPDFSYFDHPPLQAWLTTISGLLFGQNHFSVRMWALLSSIGTLLLIYFYLKKKSENFAWLACALLVSSPMFIAFSIFAVPDMLFGFIGVAVLVSVSSKRYALTGFLLGLAALAKWHSIILVPGIIYCCLKEDDLKVAIKNILMIGFICLIMQAPVIYWNYTHEWASFKFHLLQRHSGRSYSLEKFPKRFSYYLGALIGLAGPLIIWALFKFKRIKDKVAFWDLFWWSVPCLAIFLSPALKGLYRFYWLSWTIIPLSIYLAKTMSPTPNLLKKAIGFNVGTQFIFLLLMTTPIAEFTRSQFVDFNKRGKPDYFLLRKSIPIEKFVKKEILAKNEKAVVVVGDFHLASNLSWFFKNHPDMKVHAVIRQHQYEFWEMPVGSPTYLVIDKRKLFGQMKRMAKYCSGTPVWQTDVISNSYEEKKIRWAKCD